MNKWLWERLGGRKLKVIDASAPLALEVTRSDIDNSKQKDPANCAFACAVKRHLGAKAAYFMRSTAYIEYDHAVVRYDMPESMQKEIVAFDRAKAMEPGIYQLSPTPPSGRFGSKSRKKRTAAARRRRQATKRRATGKGGSPKPVSRRKNVRVPNIRVAVK